MSTEDQQPYAQPYLQGQPPRAPQADPYGRPPQGNPDGGPPQGNPYGGPYAQPSSSPQDVPAPALVDQYGRAYAAPSGGSHPVPDARAYAAQGYDASWNIPRPPLATWGPRVGAALIDGLIQAGPMLLAYLAMIPMSIADPNGESVGIIVGLLGLMGLSYAWAIGWWIFDRVIRQGRTGQSVGKRVVGLRLLHEHTVMPVGPGLALGRDFAHLLDSYSLYIGYLWPLWDDKRQTFADKVCTTVVVRA